jgi:threonine dehydrogenase-like Zn-dependent dehydrogenase
MRAEPASGATIRATITHVVAAEALGRAGDALAVTSPSGGAPPARVFIPGPLPCGECPVCRRGLCVACPHRRVVFDPGRGPTVDLPDRFITAIEDDLPAASAIGAGLVVEIIGAAARAGVGPGETTIWMGAPPWTTVGAAWSARRGCRSFCLGPAGEGAGDGAAAGVVALAADTGPDVWRRAIEAAEAAGGPGGGRPERRIFVCGAAPALARAALALASPGATLSFLHGAPATLSGLDVAGPLRIFTSGAAHPDLVPEALAAIRRGDADVSRALRQIGPADRDAAIASFRDGTDRRLPVIALEPAR